MSQENVEIVRALIPPPDVDVAALFRDDSLFEQARADLEPHIDPQLETVAVWQGGTTHAGIEGFRQTWLDWLEPWTSYYASADELIDGGDVVVALARDRGRRDDTDAEVELISGSVWEVRDDKIVRVQFYRSRDEALRAAGLLE
jgi:ketosteroid isomerase-like protein